MAMIKIVRMHVVHSWTNALLGGKSNDTTTLQSSLAVSYTGQYTFTYDPVILFQGIY